jgi:hypothetical protein
MSIAVPSLHQPYGVTEGQRREAILADFVFNNEVDD